MPSRIGFARTPGLALLVAVAATALAALLPAAADARLGDKTLRKGAHGKDVRSLQRNLRRAGYRTAIDGNFGNDTRKRVKAFEGNEERRVDGIVSPADARVLMSVAHKSSAGEEQSQQYATGGAIPTQTQSTPGAKAKLTDDGFAVPPASAPPVVKKIIVAANEIAKKPYIYGGGHGERLKDRGYDCSGSISYAFRKAGILDSSLTSGGFARWGDRGRGKWITIRANSGHVYMMVAGLRYDTSARKMTGSRWSDEMRSARGYTGRHPDGL